MERTPAARVIEKFGGPRDVARLIGIDPSRVYRWTYPKERGGTGGRIPQGAWKPLLQAAELVGVELSLTELMEDWLE